MAFPSAVLATVLNAVLDRFPEQRETLAASDVGATLLSGFTFVLGFLIVFRAQQAYNRWWEGGTLLQQLRGEWFNAFSSLMAFTNVSKDKQMEVQVFQHRICRLTSLLYACALEQVTTINNANFELVSLQGFDLESFKFLQCAHDRCEVTLQWIQRIIVEAEVTGALKIAPPILSRVYNQLGNGIVNLNNAKKILEFPIPFPLAQMVTFMLVCHYVITVLVCAASVKNPPLAGFLCFLVVFSFWSINYIAIELEMPFGDDPNDLPLVEMQTDMNKSLIQLMQPEALKPPVFKYYEGASALETSGSALDQHLLHLAPDDFAPGDVQARRKENTYLISSRLSSTMPDAEEYAAKKKSALRLTMAGDCQEMGVTRSRGSRVSRSPRVSRSSDHSPTSPKSIDAAMRASAGFESPSVSAVVVTRPSPLQQSASRVEPGPGGGSSLLQQVAATSAADAHITVQVPKEMLQNESKEGRPKESSLQGKASQFDYADVDILWLSQRMEEHLCHIARQLQALRGKDVVTADLDMWISGRSIEELQVAPVAGPGE